MVRSAARLHGHDTASRQLGTPRLEAIALDRSDCHHAALRIHSVNLNHMLGQVHPYANDLASCNLLHGLPLSMA
jgi:hypothetical protein